MLHTHRREIERYRVLSTRGKEKEREEREGERERETATLDRKLHVSRACASREDDEFRFSFVERRKRRA